MVFDSLCEKARLESKAFQGRFLERIARKRPLDPIADAEGQGVRFPTDCLRRQGFQLSTSESGRQWAFEVVEVYSQSLGMPGSFQDSIRRSWFRKRNWSGAV
jgi:hypothetical protein